MNFRRILLILFVSFTGILFSRSLLLYSNGILKEFEEAYLVEENGKEFVSLDVIGVMDSENIVSESLNSGESVIILNSGLIITLSHMDSSAKIDFGSEYPNVVLMRNGRPFLEANFLAMTAGYGYTRETSFSLMFDEPLKVMSIDLDERGLVVDFGDVFLPELVHTWYSAAGSLVVSLYPVTLDRPFSKEGISVYSGADYLKLVFAKDWLGTEIMAEGNTLIVGRPVGSDEMLEFKSGEGYVFEKFRALINEREITITRAEINPANYDVTVVLANDKVPSYENLLSMASRTGAFVMINGGYFDQSTAYPIGFLVNDGQVLSLPSLGRPVFFRKDNGEFSVSRIDFSFGVTIGNGSILVKGVNTPYKGESLLYNDSFRGIIPYREGSTYVLITDGMIEEIGYRKYLYGGQSMLALSETGMEKLGAECVQVGAKVTIELVNGDSSIDFAVEGGPMIIDNGLPVTDDEKQYYNQSLITARAPRTLVGITGSGRIDFIVIDGYQSESGGLNFSEMVEFFKGKGYESLMCLDGGKSSAILLDGRVMNNPPAGVPQLPIGIMINKK